MSQYAFNNLGAALHLALSCYPFLVVSRRPIWAKALIVSSAIIGVRILKVEIGL